MSTGKPHASKSNNDRAKQYGDSQSPPSDTLFIGNLSFNANRDNLFNVFGEYGNVISCRVPTHPDTQQPKGFGYVQFSSVDEAKAALEAMNGEYIEGRPCRLDFSTPEITPTTTTIIEEVVLVVVLAVVKDQLLQDPVTAPQDQISQLNSKVLRRPLIKPSV